MIDVESLCDRFKFGDIERIFVCFYSYFLIGFFILFSTYEQNFLDLEIHVQIFLMLGISFPISLLFILIRDDFEDKEGNKYGVFYQSTGASALASIWYIGSFSLFYIIKHIEITNYNNKFDPIIAIVIILSGFIIAHLRKEM